VRVESKRKASGTRDQRRKCSNFFVRDSSVCGERGQCESSLHSTNPRDSVELVHLRQRVVEVEQQWMAQRRAAAAQRRTVQQNVCNNIPERRSAAFIAGEALAKAMVEQ